MLGVGLIFVMAGVVGAMDAARASMWREVAAQRRQSWEARLDQPGAVVAEFDGPAVRTPGRPGLRGAV